MTTEKQQKWALILLYGLLFLDSLSIAPVLLFARR